MDTTAIRNIYAAGRNYAAHAAELGNARPDEPVLFSKSASGLTTSAQLCFPQALGTIHHEVEIVVRIGHAVACGEYDGLAAVDAVGLGLDMTARDRQRALAQAGLPWFLAKNFQDAAYVGGLKAGADPAARYTFDLDKNGSRVQHGDTELMLFSVDELLRSLNQTLPLHPGDLIYTGTPAGVGPVTAGDRLRLSCAGLNLDCEVQISFVS